MLMSACVHIYYTDERSCDLRGARDTKKAQLIVCRSGEWGFGSRTQTRGNGLCIGGVSQ